VKPEAAQKPVEHLAGVKPGGVEHAWVTTGRRCGLALCQKQQRSAPRSVVAERAADPVEKTAVAVETRVRSRSRRGLEPRLRQV